jgi:hypothetical protein
MDILAFGSARGTRDRVGVRRHSVRYEVCAVGRRRRLHHPRDRMQGQNGLKVRQALMEREPPMLRSGALRDAPVQITYWGDFVPGARHCSR